MATPVEVPLAGPSLESTVTAGERQIAGRSLSQIAWRRLRKDKAAITGLIVILLLVVIALIAPLITRLVGVSPNLQNSKILNEFGLPSGPFGGASHAHPLGVEPGLGRDVLARILYGARTSLSIAFLSTLVTVSLGVVVGIVAGYFGGWIDSLLSRTMDILLAFPVLLFSLALLTIIGNSSALNGNVPRYFIIVFIIGFFGWPYIGRVIRGQVISLREKEFIDAARSLGASNSRILFVELLPNLIAPILVYSSLVIPTNILTEAAYSFLGVGLQPPASSWGQMLSNAVQYYQIDPTYMVIPGTAILVTVLAFNIFGDGLSDAFDPRGKR
jgi:peptide/nickel transport system permease protein